MDTFVDSSWYFLRYTSPHSALAWEPDKVKLWMPVDLYTGGAEHAVLHLMYARFFVKALRDMGMLDFGEPFLALRNQGQILGADHQRMSKSRGNVANPDELVARYGSDAVRCFLMFIGPWDQGGPWNAAGIEGIYRFLARVWHAAQPSEPRQRPRVASDIPGMPPPSSLVGEIPGSAGPSGSELLDAAQVDRELARALRRITHVTIAGVSDDIGGFRFNTALAKLMELTNAIARARESGLAGTDVYADAVDTLLLLLAPIAPHISEELWARRGNEYSIHQQAWPAYDAALAASETIELPVQVNGKLRDRVVVTVDTPAAEIERLALESERVQAYLDGRPPRRVIQVPGKLINIVTPD
jgi:leucyl-tRNA synthetase